MNKFLRILLVSSLIILCCCHFSYGKVQRMGIPKGVYKLAPKQAKSVKTYCLDLHRSAPSSNDVMGHVLGASSQAVVSVGGHAMPLQKALDEGIVSIGGRAVDESMFPPLPTKEEFIKSMEVELKNDQSLEGKELFKEMEAMSSQEKYDLAEMFLEEMEYEREFHIEALRRSGAGNFSNMNLINNTDKDVSIEFVENGIVGKNVEPVDDLNFHKLDFKSPGDAMGQKAVQDSIWLASQQRKLLDLGYSPGRTDGVLDSNTSQAFVKFQQSMGVGSPREWKEWGKLLDEVKVFKTKTAGEVPPATAIRMLEENPPHFAVILPDGNIKGLDTKQDLIKFISEAKSVKGNGKTIMMDRFSEGDAIAFATTIRIRNVASNPQNRVKFAGIKNIRLTKSFPKVYKNKDGMWVAEMPLDIRNDQKRTLRIITAFEEKTRSLLQKVAQFLKKDEDVLNLSTEQMIEKMKKYLPVEEGIGVFDEEIKKFFLVDVSSNTRISRITV